MKWHVLETAFEYFNCRIYIVFFPVQYFQFNKTFSSSWNKQNNCCHISLSSLPFSSSRYETRWQSCNCQNTEHKHRAMVLCSGTSSSVLVIPDIECFIYILGFECHAIFWNSFVSYIWNCPHESVNQRWLVCTIEKNVESQIWVCSSHLWVKTADKFCYHWLPLPDNSVVSHAST